MKIWIRWTFCVLTLGLTSACAGSVYREEFNAGAPFEAYEYYSVAEAHPFDGDARDDALLSALKVALDLPNLQANADADTLPRRLIFVLNLDIEAGRTRVLALAANKVRNWSFQLDKQAPKQDLVALEVYERQSGNLVYRVEAARGPTPDETIARLLSRFPPSARRARGVRQRSAS